MKLFWKPLGRVFKIENLAPWAISHASHPIALDLGQGCFRIYFSTRDAQNRSSTGSIEIEIDGERFAVVRGLEGPHLSPGQSGFFDADGVTVSSLIRHADRVYGFYLGWTALRHVPFANFVGLAISDDNGVTFTRESPVPILGRTRENPITLSYPFVIRDGRGWRMWYGSHLSWANATEPMLHVLKQAHSENLIDWTLEEGTVIDLNRTRETHEFAISRPCVIRESERALSMWYAIRRPSYAIGYAISLSPGVWERRDDAILFNGEPEEWERAERTYPYVFDHGSRRYMLYNGNGYGREGFGIAVLEA